MLCALKQLQWFFASAKFSRWQDNDARPVRVCSNKEICIDPASHGGHNYILSRIMAYFYYSRACLDIYFLLIFTFKTQNSVPDIHVKACAWLAKCHGCSVVPPWHLNHKLKSVSLKSWLKAKDVEQENIGYGAGKPEVPQWGSMTSCGYPKTRRGMYIKWGNPETLT